MPEEAIAGFVLGIDHIGVAVSDFEAAMALHQGAFGFASAHEEVNDEQGVREAMLPIGDGGPSIQLLAATRDDSPVAKFVARNGPGVHHIAYTVADVVAASARLREAGVRMLYDEPRLGTAGSRVNFTHPKDTGGVLIEIVQPVQQAEGAT